jgi:hypothetical protein
MKSRAIQRIVLYMSITPVALMLLYTFTSDAYGQGLLDPETEPDPDLGTGTGYYPPPYSYDECLTVFSKEACDFRFNR